MATSIETGTDTPVAEPQVDADPGVQPEPVSDAGGEDEFTAKVRAGGDFAVQQVKAAQRELSRKQARLGGFEEIAERVGNAEVVKGHLQRLARISTNPQLLALVEQYEQTGQLPNALLKNGAEEKPTEYEDPWDQSIKPVAGKVSALEAELTALRAERGVEKVRGYFKDFFDEFSLDPEDQKDLTAAMTQQVQEWTKTPDGRRALDVMNPRTFRSLALDKLTKEQLRSAVLREEEARRQQRSAAATDVPARGATGKDRPQAPNPAAAFEQICRELGVDPNKPLLR